MASRSSRHVGFSEVHAWRVGQQKCLVGKTSYRCDYGNGSLRIGKCVTFLLTTEVQTIARKKARRGRAFNLCISVFLTQWVIIHRLIALNTRAATPDVALTTEAIVRVTSRRRLE